MTQLYIGGTEVVLPQNFSVTVKRENSFFTKNGEYTYDITLQLDNQANRTLFGFLERINKQDQVSTHRTAVLIADGHVYCRGTEIITRWTDESVTIQIVSGESELNYFIGQDQKIEELDLGTVRDKASEVSYPLIRTSTGKFVNIILTEYESGGATFHRVDHAEQSPSPYLLTLINKIMDALGYTITDNQLEDSLFAHLVILNTHNTTRFASMVKGWTVKDFLTEVEKLTGVVFVTDNLNKQVKIILKTNYYLTAEQFTVRDIVDAYEANVEDDESRQSEFTASDVAYDMPDGRWSKIMRLPESLPQYSVEEYANFDQLKRRASTESAINAVIYKDTSTGRMYIRTKRTRTDPRMGDIVTYFLLEVDQFRNLDRDDCGNTMELKISPVPMAPSYYARAGLEIADLGNSDGYYDFHYSDAAIDEDAEEDQSDEYKELFEDTIRESEKDENSAQELYCAFFDGIVRNEFPQIFTDGYHASMVPQLYNYERSYDTSFNPACSLRLKDLDEGYYQGGYEIDTRHAMTFETYDPNMIDPRQVYVVRNKRFVVRDIEEVITASGRQPKWKMTCYPIHVSDEALEKRWVLTKGVWDDGAAWLDDGRWNDGPEQSPAPAPDPSPSPEGDEPDSIFIYTLDAFSGVNIPTNGTTYNHLLRMYNEAKAQFFDGRSLNGLPLLFSQANFPSVYDYYGNTQQRQQAFQKMCAWMFAMVLAELKPSIRDSLYTDAYDVWGEGKSIATYQHRFDSDTNVARLVGSAFYSTMHDASKIQTMRTELGGSTISYQNSIYEVLVDTRRFMPQAPGPYLQGYDISGRTGVTPKGESPGGYPAGEANTDHNLTMDQAVYDYITEHYSLDAADAGMRQRAIQAVADKEYNVEHLFGTDHTVTDPGYGTMTFHPVFGTHNIGVEISVSGAIANLVNAVAMDCSRTRETLLTQQYGRRRPGQGDTDKSAKTATKDRALVNYAIEEGDGRSTGYYNEDGDYIYHDGTHIGDYTEYFQKQLSANSYPSGHSAYIWGAALALMEVMPDRADRIMRAANDFAQSRVVARYHWMSDTIHGRVIGSVMIPVEHALTNRGWDTLLAAARREYQAISG